MKTVYPSVYPIEKSNNYYPVVAGIYASYY